MTWGGFKHNNVPEFPQFGPIIILLLNVIEDPIVWEYFLILNIINSATKLEPFGITVKLGILLLNDLDNVRSKSLTIFLWIKKEGVSNKVWEVEHRELWW